jgi:hypothetical protein
MATGMAKGAAKRGKRIAFGDGQKIIWDHLSDQIFKGNTNIAPPGSEVDPDIEWIPFYRGNRLYNRQNGLTWVYNYDFRAIPGEIFFDVNEKRFARDITPGFVLIEPNVKQAAPNKQWPKERYYKIARRLMRAGHDVRQLYYVNSYQMPGIKQIKTSTFRQALAVLSRAALYIGAEGGLHHGAAALGIPAVVIFGGFTPVEITGYAGHINLDGGSTACGSIRPCEHCKQAMDAISVSDVEDAAKSLLVRVAA